MEPTACLPLRKTWQRVRDGRGAAYGIGDLALPVSEIQKVGLYELGWRWRLVLELCAGGGQCGAGTLAYNGAMVWGTCHIMRIEAMPYFGGGRVRF